MAKSQKGRAIFEENIYDIPLNVSSNFYFYKNGIVIRFDPYEVAPFSEGFVDVFVNNLTLNKPVKNAIPETVVPQPNIPDYDVIESNIDDDFEGYDEGNFTSWLTDRFGNKSIIIILIHIHTDQK